VLRLTEAGPDGFSVIATLAHKIWNIHYPPIVGQAQVDYMLEKFYSYDALEKQYNEGQHFYLIQKDAGNIGFISLSEKEKGNFFLHKFYINKGDQGKGLGKQVFEMIKELTGVRDKLSITLTVNRQNYKAINFYFKNGFRIRETADFDIGNGYFMNDFIMEWKN
jgi:ribosomal protein S18 acetylase RimI-like enzyme